MQCLATAAFAPREYVRGWWRSPVLWAGSCRWLRAVRSPRSSPAATPGHLVRGRADCWMRWWHPPAGLVTMPIERSVRMKADRMVGRCARGDTAPPGLRPAARLPVRHDGLPVRLLALPRHRPSHTCARTAPGLSWRTSSTPTSTRGKSAAPGTPASTGISSRRSPGNVSSCNHAAGGSEFSVARS